MYFRFGSRSNSLIFCSIIFEISFRVALSKNRIDSLKNFPKYFVNSSNRQLQEDSPAV